MNILDFLVRQPDVSCGHEPTLRNLIHQYYNSWVPELFAAERANELANEYIKQIEDQIGIRGTYARANATEAVKAVYEASRMDASKVLYDQS